MSFVLTKRIKWIIGFCITLLLISFITLWINNVIYKPNPLYPPKLAIWNRDLVLWDRNYYNVDKFEEFYRSIKNKEHAVIKYTRYDVNHEDFEDVDVYNQLRGPLFHTFVSYKVTYDGEYISFRQIGGEEVPWNNSVFTDIDKEVNDYYIMYILLLEDQHSEFPFVKIPINNEK